MANVFVRRIADAKQQHLAFLKMPNVVDRILDYRQDFCVNSASLGSNL